MNVNHPKVKAAINSLIFDNPFFASMILQQQIIEDNSTNNPTFCVDGKHLFYNSEFADSLTIQEIKGVLAHEVCHLCANHLGRMKGKEIKRWNYATDYSLNGELLRAGFILPKGVLIDVKYTGKSAEDIYRLLGIEEDKKKEEQNKQNSQNKQKSDKSKEKGDGKGEKSDEKADKGDKSDISDKQDKSKGDKGENSDESGDNSGDSSESNNGEENESNDGEPKTFGEIKAPIDDSIEELTKVQSKLAENAAKMAGKLPSNGLIEIIKNGQKPSFDWQEILNRFICENCAKDYSFSHVNKRHLGRGIILPTLFSQELGKIVIAIDTSGSVNLRDVTNMVNEAVNILENVSKDNYELTVIYFDTIIQNIQVFEPNSDIKPLPKGGGGTDYKEIFKYIANNDLGDIKGAIILTDGYCNSFGEISPDYPILWGLIEDNSTFKPPFGEIFKFNNY